MVGRGGRSKGCATCRRRRVRCDQSKPTCQNCRRLGLECGGYRPVTFVNESIHDTRPCENIQDAPLSVSSVHQGLLEDDKVHDFLEILAFKGISTTSTRCRPLLPPKDWTIEIFTLRTLFRGERHGTGCWLPFLISQTGDNALASKCFSALAHVAFGRAHQHLLIENKGKRAYGRMLVAVNSKLRDQSMATCTDTVASVAILGVYECLSRTSGEAWVHHQFGLANLFKLRGPHAHTSLIDRQLLENLRFQIIMASLTQRKRTFLAEREWKTVPWSQSEKSDYQCLIDLFADIPGMFETIDYIEPDGNHASRFVECEMLLDKVSELIGQSEAWFERWRDNHPGAAKPRRKDMQKCTLEVLLLPPPPLDAAHELEFDSLVEANLFLLYHMLRILLHEIVVSACNLEPGLPTQSHLSEIKSIDAIDHSVNCIIASVPYHVALPLPSGGNNDPAEHHAPSMGTYFLIAPLRTARFPATETHRRWLDTVLDLIAEITHVPRACGDVYKCGVVGWRLAGCKPWVEQGVTSFPRPQR